MKNIFLFLIFLIPLVSYSVDPEFSIKAATGINTTFKEYVGIATDISLCYHLTNLVGVEFSTNNLYSYNHDGEITFSESYTNTALGLGLVLSPINMGRHHVGLFGGLSKNYLCATNFLPEFADPERFLDGASASRFTRIKPFCGTSYSYSFDNFSLGVDYRLSFLRVVNRNISNNQFLISVTTYF